MQIPLFDYYALRSLRKSDAADIFSAIEEQREYLGRWLPFVATTHRIEQTRAVVADMLADKYNPVFTLRDADTFVGLIGFKSANPGPGTIEIGYWMRAEYQHRGIMTAAVRTLCEHAFGSLGMRRIEIRCAIGNEPSNRIPQRLGFRLDHIDLRAEELSNGDYADLNIYILDKTPHK